ncbi:MAG TPA: hypothetical protein VES42_02885 [Pilimelia sp.]|nr:hypothetical protein [Pilimelia sp.]
MRRAIERFVLRVVGSRYGVAAVLAVLVLGILGSANLLAGPDREPAGVAGAPERPLVTADPTAGDDGVVASRPAPAPVTSPGTAKPLSVARAFALAWLDHRDVPADTWHAGMLPHSTEALSRKLAGVDPAGVPADRITGAPTLIPLAESVADVNVPIDAGTLRLRLVAPEGRWLVDGVDWVRA